MKITALFLLFLYPLLLIAKEDNFQKWERISKTYQEDFNDPSFSTLWGGLRRALHWPNHKGKMVDLLPKGFKDKIPIYINASDTKKDLYLFYPGIFGKPDGKTSPHAIDALEELGGHVVSVPNILADTYLNARPKMSTRGLEQERESQTLLFEAIIQLVGKKNIGKIHVLAESLGTFQALQINHKFDSLKILAPPLYLDRAIRRFDELIAKQSKALSKCTLWWKWPVVAYKIKTNASPLDISQEDKSCFGAWVIAGGFVMSIKKTANNIKNKKLTTEPENFSQFVDTILPDFSEPLKNKDERLSLPYLLRNTKTPIESITIISSKDDYLNELPEWDDLKREFPPLLDKIFLFTWGGHSGPISLDGFITDLYQKSSP
jgi:hypothetical protein